MSLLLAQGDARALPLTAGCVHACITSPPYWGLRDYGLNGAGIGREASLDDWIAAMVQVFREVRRVIHPTGTVWLNLGDRYDDGDLLGLPWRVALALQADGWWLRSDIVWAKANPLPEPDQGRPTRAHEYVFLLAKQERYFYDNEAVRERNRTGPWRKAPPIGGRKLTDSGIDGRARGNQPSVDGYRNLRDVWTLTSQAWPGAHFATFPEALVRPCILAGTSAKGVCPDCGAPFERVTTATFSVNSWHGGVVGRREDTGAKGYDGANMPRRDKHVTTLGWRPTCDHGKEPVPALVLDPFCGTATTGVVARKLGRHFIGIDLSGPYLHDQARVRLGLAPFAGVVAA
jgi:site-specific DNA-methyltransferase (adenine-specific)